ncbi:MAG: hypothetical protein ACR2QW_13085, partial [bacterium]
LIQVLMQMDEFPGRVWDDTGNRDARPGPRSGTSGRLTSSRVRPGMTRVIEILSSRTPIRDLRQIDEVPGQARDDVGNRDTVVLNLNLNQIQDDASEKEPTQSPQPGPQLLDPRPQ